MKTKQMNLMLLCGFIFHIIAVFAISIYGQNHMIPTWFSMIAGELVLVIPAVLFFLFYLLTKKQEEESAAERLHYRRVKGSTLLMTVVFTYLMMPLTTVINAISMLFVDNALLGVSEEMLSFSLPVMLFFVAVIPAFCEETIFRGMVHGAYRKSSKGYLAVLMSGLMFGLMHMNINQAMYAFALGIALALLLEASGSIWATILFHFITNAQSCVLMYVMEKLMPTTYYSEMAAAIPKQEMYMAISVYLVIAAVTTPIAMCALYWIAKNEGRVEQLLECIPGRQESADGKIITIPLVLAILTAVGYMIFMELLNFFV